MKVNPKTNARVKDSVNECRRALVTSIVDLLKQLGVESCEDKSLGKMLIMHQGYGAESRTYIADSIAYNERGKGTTYLFLWHGDNRDCVSDLNLSLDSLQYIYKEVRKLVYAQK